MTYRHILSRRFMLNLNTSLKRNVRRKSMFVPAAQLRNSKTNGRRESYKRWNINFLDLRNYSTTRQAWPSRSVEKIALASR